MKEHDKRKSHKNSKLIMTFVSSNNVIHPVTMNGRTGQYHKLPQSDHH
jgi:hypothetical protein